MSMSRKIKILVLADDVDRALYDFYTPGRFDGIDLILSCGDLPSHYLSFIATFFNGPIFYVHGNHDEDYLKHPPGGCVDIDGKFIDFEGIRILGLGGSYRYKPGPYQYTQRQMNWRVAKLFWKIAYHKGFDILLTHAPAYHLHDKPDPCHTGFEAFRNLIEKYHPRYLIHGHVHLNYGHQPRISEYEGTTIVNAYEKYIIEYEIDE